MEPMNIGSPTSSVGIFSSGFQSNVNNRGFGSPNQQTASTPTSSAPYLPSYLLGYENPRVQSNSPGNRGSAFISSPASPLSSKEPANFAALKIGRNERGGPPIVPLSPQTPHLRTPQNDHIQRTHSNTPLASPVTSRVAGSPLNASVISVDVHEDAIKAAGNCVWVTVFGFPSASASLILTQFAQLGTIVNQKVPGTGNWMHLRYQTPLQAKRALALHGKVIGGNMMIGVMLCTDRTITSSTDDCRDGTETIKPPFPNSFNETPKAHFRSLTQSYQSTPNDNQVMKMSDETPKKNDSLLSRAMQTILGV